MAKRKPKVILPATLDRRLVFSNDREYSVIRKGPDGILQPHDPDIIWHDRSMPSAKVLTSRRYLAFPRRASFHLNDLAIGSRGKGLGIYFEDENCAGAVWEFRNRDQIKEFLQHNGIYRPAATKADLTRQFWNKPLIVFYAGSGRGIDNYVIGVGLKKNLTDLLAERPIKRNLLF